MAAEIGIELFLVDAGWYGPKEKHWSQCVGDWTENPILGEGGLMEVFDYARCQGMKCGLWLPPEWVWAFHRQWRLPQHAAYQPIHAGTVEACN